MKILVDMNLSPAWCDLLRRQGWESVHWSNIGAPNAPDFEIMRWALANAFVVFTHDLDFTHILAMTRATGPSVIQVRTMDVLPDSLGPKLISILRQVEIALKAGALVTVDDARSRLRVLPLR